MAAVLAAIRAPVQGPVPLKAAPPVVIRTWPWDMSKDRPHIAPGVVAAIRIPAHICTPALTCVDIDADRLTPVVVILSVDPAIMILLRV